MRFIKFGSQKKIQEIYLYFLRIYEVVFFVTSKVCVAPNVPSYRDQLQIYRTNVRNGRKQRV